MYDEAEAHDIQVNHLSMNHAPVNQFRMNHVPMKSLFHDFKLFACSQRGVGCACLLAAGVLLGILAVNSSFLEDANAMLEGELHVAESVSTDFATMDDFLQELPTIAGQASPPVVTNKRVRVKSGDNISTLLGEVGVRPGELQRLLRNAEQASELRRVFPGQWIEVGVLPDGTLNLIRVERDAANSIEWRRGEDSSDFQLHIERIEPDVRVSFASETIVNSLFIAGQRGGLGDEIILRLAKIFRWDIDFVLDVRVGDSFELLYESEYLDGEFHRYGDILAARFTNRGKVHTALRYINDEGEKDYYTPVGKNLRGAFLRAPVDFTRVSSGFSYKRRHPLFDRVRAHLGVDYAAPTGTPVKAAGNGSVKTVDRRSSSGNYIEIAHAGGIETRYLHLSRFARGIKPGTRVRQGDVIGYVGATGWATGPHLHYEYIENGRHLDPRKTKVIRDSAIADADMSLFLAQTTPLHDRLNSFNSRISVIGAN